jgi:hypothetical protein
MLIVGQYSLVEIDLSTISGDTSNDLGFFQGGFAHLKQTVVGTTRYKDATLS